MSWMHTSIQSFMKFRPMSKYRIIISDEARRQLGNCILFIAKENMEAAQQLSLRLMEAIQSHCDMPTRYPFFNEPYIPANKYHKIIIQNWYLILYQIRDTNVFVEYVVDCR